MVTEGNHEMELIKESMPFLAYEMRYWVPHKAAKSPSKLFYSYEVRCWVPHSVALLVRGARRYQTAARNASQQRMAASRA